MNYYEITKAIRMKLEYVHAAAGEKDADNITFNIPDVYKSRFEDIVCDYVDAVNEIKRVKNLNKRACMFYDAIGYEQWQTGEILKMSQQAVSNNIKWLKRFFSNMVVK
jgi:hypothetical protein